MERTRGLPSQPLLDSAFLANPTRHERPQARAPPKAHRELAHRHFHISPMLTVYRAKQQHEHSIRGRGVCNYCDGHGNGTIDRPTGSTCRALQGNCTANLLCRADSWIISISSILVGRRRWTAGVEASGTRPTQHGANKSGLEERSGNLQAL